MHGAESWDLLARFKQQPRTADVPLLVVSSVDDQHKAIALGADAFHLKPLDPAWLIRTLESFSERPGAQRVLVIDDQDASRFILREMLRGRDQDVIEAVSGRDGLAQAQRVMPSLILLDLHLGDIDGLDVREALRRDPLTAHVPVIVVTSRKVSDVDRERLGAGTPVLSKADLTREQVHAAMDHAIESASQSWDGAGEGS
jgi:CheY-like chemotaxis protein